MSLEILGCRLDLVDADTAAEKIFERIHQQHPAQIVTLGTEMVVYAQRDLRFRDIVNASTLTVCDTVGLLAVARKRGAQLRERVTGIELIDRLCGRASQENIAVFLFGGADGVAAESGRRLCERYPALRIAGTQTGYVHENENTHIVETIRASGARLVFVGLGSPRQEFWIARHLGELGAVSAIGVGGSFDVIAGKVQRAPRVWQRLHLEWLYRFVREPQRWRRQLALPYFVWLIACESLTGRAKRVSESFREPS